MEPHGYLKFTWVDDVLYLEAHGPFNDEGAKAAAEAYVELIHNRKHPTFSVVEVLENDSMGSPNTMAEVSRIWDFIGENGCVALALVYANEVQRILAEPYLPPFGKLFRSVKDAEEWVSARRNGHKPD